MARPFDLDVLWESENALVVSTQARLESRNFDARHPQEVARLAQLCGWSGPILQAEQVHADRILRFGEQGCADAFLIERGQAALVRHADCFPVVILAPDRHEAVVAHCGWRGAALGLAGASVRALVARGAQVSQLRAFVGAGIQRKSFEVGESVLQAFPAQFHGKTAWGSDSVDLSAFLRADLQQNGVLPHLVRCVAKDTFTDIAYHSHRRDAQHAGRLATVCMLS
jgi:copper oxidase (laccase) domain-containing protein